MKSSNFKILGSEPAAYVGVIELFLALLLSMHVLGLTQHLIGLIMAVVTACFGVAQAFVVRHGLYAALMGFFKAGIALGVGYGAPLNDVQVSLIIGVMAAVLGIVLRATTHSLDTPVTNASPGAYREAA